VPRQHVNHKMPPTEGRTNSIKRKHDASKTLDEWIEKQHETSRALHVEYRKHMQ
jgi:hypothetical protein